MPYESVRKPPGGEQGRGGGVGGGGGNGGGFFKINKIITGVEKTGEKR